MLPLNDLIWKKLDDAHRDRDIPELLSRLAKAWDDETANSLLYDRLCHQETCYGATYAAIPHLLKIAQPEGSRHQRLQIAVFSGFVMLCAFKTRQSPSDEIESSPLQGLPLTPDAWDRKLDCFRSLLAGLEDPDRYSSRYEQIVLRPRYKKILAVGPVHAGDLEKVRSIKADFISSLPTIRAVCERALLENLQNEDAVQCLLSGIAAADGLLNLARLLNLGPQGQFRCSSCNCGHEYIMFGDRVAFYAEEDKPPQANAAADGRDRALLDYKEHAPSRSDGFMVPAAAGEAFGGRATALLSLADRAQSPEPALLLRSFLGSFLCCRCGAKGPICAV
jgi:hypothetical protein